MKFEDKTRLIDIAWRYIHLIDQIIDNDNGIVTKESKSYWIGVRNGILKAIIDACKEDIDTMNKNINKKENTRRRFKKPHKKVNKTCDPNSYVTLQEFLQKGNE